jgi:hypothetical protein
MGNLGEGEPCQTGWTKRRTKYDSQLQDGEQQAEKYLGVEDQDNQGGNQQS